MSECHVHSDILFFVSIRFIRNFSIIYLLYLGNSLIINT